MILVNKQHDVSFEKYVYPSINICINFQNGILFKNEEEGYVNVLSIHNSIESSKMQIGINKDYFVIPYLSNHQSTSRIKTSDGEFKYISPYDFLLRVNYLWGFMQHRYTLDQYCMLMTVLIKEDKVEEYINYCYGNIQTNLDIRMYKFVFHPNAIKIFPYFETLIKDFQNNYFDVEIREPKCVLIKTSEHKLTKDRQASTNELKEFINQKRKRMSEAESRAILYSDNTPVHNQGISQPEEERNLLQQIPRIA